MVGESTDVFLIADMSDVWVDLKVHQKDLPYIRKGQRVRIVPGPGVPEAEGTISLISPILEEATRTCLARVVLPNPAGALRPGLFVTAHVAVRESNIPVLAPKDAVRRIESKPVVFVPVRQGLMPRPVTLGRSSRTHVEIVSGLRPGEKYVVKGAFALQAKIVTTGLGAHAGHGH